MHILTARDVINALPYDRLVRGLPPLLLRSTTSPQRHVHTIEQPGEPDAMLLLMPAWSVSGGAGMGGVKIVGVTPGNSARGLAAVTASYLVFDTMTGEHKALLDGGELTARRTAAVAAVAADRLAGHAAHKLLLVGSGRIAGELAHAYRAVRDIREVAVWSPTAHNAEKLAHGLRADGFAATAGTDLEAAARGADIIACATLSTAPLIKGAWLRPGQHLALIGGYTPAMREADDAAMTMGRVWIDSRAGLAEAGDLIDPAGLQIAGTLSDLCAVATIDGRTDTLTVFKSVGDASQDLAAATLALGG